MDRHSFLGSSDAAAVLGLSRWSTPLQVWAEKTGQIETKDISDKLAVRLGVALEQTVADLFMEETEKRVFKVSENQVHPNYPFITCQIDRRVVGEDALLECKTASSWKAREWEGDEIPQEYIIQVMHQLAVTGKAYGYIAVLIGNQDFKWKRIDRDEKAIKEIVSREVSFWNNYIVPNVMPGVISCQDSDTLYQLFEKAVPDSVLAMGDEVNQIVEDIKNLERDADGLKGSIEQKKNVLKSMLGDNECGVSSQFKITWKNRHRKEYTVKPCDYRELRIYENKGDK
jgi:putative phage-type endonuclease